jgi:choline/ethanolamine kinase
MSAVATRFFQHIKQVRPSWRLQNIQVNQINCALSNNVYQVANGNEKLLLRIYGSTDHGIFKREDEVRQTCKLGALGFGPKILSTFDDGRIESWIEGFTPSNQFMRSNAAIQVVARKLRALHDKTGLNHNDLHRNNMLCQADGSVEFLDFEYSGPADPAYDIANHFNEWMYPYIGQDDHLFQLQLYPNLFQRRLFAASYLGDTAGKGSIVDDFLAHVEKRRDDSHEFWIAWAEKQPSDFNNLYARARRSLLEMEELPAQGLIDSSLKGPVALFWLLKQQQQKLPTSSSVASC